MGPKAQTKKIIDGVSAEAEIFFKEAENIPTSNGSNKIKPLRAIRFSDVETKTPEWLWHPFLALGTFNILEGEEGIGKTFLVCALATAIASGRGLPLVPFGEHIEPSNVVLISAEDSFSFVLKSRLESMHAPCERIIGVDEPFTLDAVGIFRLSMLLAEYQPKLTVIDPIFSYTGKINLDRDNDIRSVTDELKRLAEKHRCAIVGIRHIGKSKGMGDARNAGLNGIGWRASARSVLLIGKDPNNERQKALCQTKNNLAAKFEKSIGFEIADGQFRWTGESTLTAATMLTALRVETDEDKNARLDATTFLREWLRPGEQLATDIFDDARKYRISERTLNRVKKDLNVQSRKEGYGKNSKWFWSLPEDSLNNDNDCQNYSSGNLKPNDENKTIYHNNLSKDCQSNINGNVSKEIGNLRGNAPNCSKCGLEMSLIENGSLWFCTFGCESREANENEK